MAFYVPKSEIQQIPNYENNYRMTPKKLFNGNLYSQAQKSQAVFQCKMYAQRLKKQ